MIREGYINKIIYQNEDNGYAVFVVETSEGDDIFVGNIPGVAEGMYIQADGEYVHHPQYDIQFKVNSSELSMPSDIDGIVRFLGSGMIKGIGEALAKRIVKKFREDTLRIIDEEPERLAEVKGISMKMAEKIAVRYSENRSYRNVVMFLSKYGISIKTSMKIYKEFGDEIYNIIRKNPYKIADHVPGIGFKTVDSIAMQSGIAADSEYRISSAFIYTLNQSMSLGHMYMPQNLLINEVFNLLKPNLSHEEFEEQAEKILGDMIIEARIMIDDEGRSSGNKGAVEDRLQVLFDELDLDNGASADGKHLNDRKNLHDIKDEDDISQTDSSDLSDNTPHIYTRWNYRTELESARRLLELRLDYETDESEILDAIGQVEKDTEMELSDEQKNAVLLAVSSGVSVITGGPGTGKTTIINAIIRYFEFQGDRVLLAAPTGRAAKRITESTGYKAETIHRMLEFSGEPGEDGEKVALRFNRNEMNPLETEAVIIDEASMVDASLMHSLLKAIVPGCRLVLVGDTDQLPSVGAGNVLHDIISSDCFPVTTLSRIYRQADKSSIVENAHKIKDGIHLEINNKSSDFFFIPRRNPTDISRELGELVTKNLPDYLGVSALDIEVITPTRQFELGCMELNKKLQKKLNPPSPDKREKEHGDIILREGDKVMQIRNNYKLEWTVYSEKGKGLIIDQGIGVFNGDMGIISEINDFDERVIIKFDDGRVAEYEYSQLDELEHAFAITIHKSQGSEYPAVVIPIYAGPPKLLNRNLLYTAVTRAKQMVVIVGNLNKVNEMIDNILEQKRYTGFERRIREMAAQSEHDEYMSLFDE